MEKINYLTRHEAFFLSKTEKSGKSENRGHSPWEERNSEVFIFSDVTLTFYKGEADRNKRNNLKIH